MRLLVCGARNFCDPGLVSRNLSNMHCVHGVEALLEGGATGVDRFAREWAQERGIPVETFEADWTAYGKAAGPMRNRRMLHEGKPHCVLAFPGGRGTADMVRAARQAGVMVIDLAA